MMSRRCYVIAVVTALLSSNLVVVESWKTISFIQLQHQRRQRRSFHQNITPRPQRTVSSRIRGVSAKNNVALYAEINNRRSFLASSGAAVLASLFLPTAAAKAVLSPLESSGYPYTPSPLPTSVKTAAELASFTSSSQTKQQNQAKSSDDVVLGNSNLLVSKSKNADLLEAFGKQLSGSSSSSSSLSSQYPFTPSPLPTSVKTAKELTDSTTDSSLPSTSLATPTGKDEGQGSSKPSFPLSLEDFIEEASRQKQIEPLSHGV